MLKVEIWGDSNEGKYHPNITVNIWNLGTIWRAWSLYGSPIWVSPITLRFLPIRFKHIQLPDDWPEQYAERYFLIATLWELGICDNVPGG